MNMKKLFKVERKQISFWRNRVGQDTKNRESVVYEEL